MEWINYNKELMSLSFEWKWRGKVHNKYLTCPFATWWKARKYFKKPTFKFFFGKHVFWPWVSTEFLKWYTPKWFPIYIGSHDVYIKDKWNSPRHERDGYFVISIGRNYETAWQFGFIVKSPKIFIYDCTELDGEQNYWESIDWYLNYSKEYGMKDYKHRDLIKARNSLQNHWSTSKSIPIKKFKILSTSTEKVLGETYFKISLQCKYLINELFWNFAPISEKRVFIKVTKEGISKTVHSNFIYNTHNETVEIYIRPRPYTNEFIELIQSEYNNVEIEYVYNIDLGPTFKDQFLNKRGIKLIQDEYRRNKESGK